MLAAIRPVVRSSVMYRRAATGEPRKGILGRRLPTDLLVCYKQALRLRVSERSREG
jgi:hypothetical protein